MLHKAPTTDTSMPADDAGLDLEIDAYNVGFIAARNGHPKSACPFARGPLRKCWTSGYSIWDIFAPKAVASC